MSNLIKIVPNNLNSINSSKYLASLSLGNVLGKDMKGVFSNLIASEKQNLVKSRGSIVDFLKFLKNNGLINKGFKNVSLNEDVAFERLRGNDFVSNLKSLINRMDNLFDFENLSTLSESLSLGSEVVDRKEILKNMENFLSELNSLFRNLNSILDLNTLGFAYGDSNVEKGNKDKNVINIDVKDFKRNDNVKEFVNAGASLRIVDSENSVGKYIFKEAFDGIREFCGNLSSVDTKYVKEFLSGNIADNLMSEWNLKINHNIVNKVKIVLKSNDTGEIRLILKPRELGSIRINLNLDSNNNLLGKIIVDNQNVRTLFEQNMYSISKMLDDNGFNTSLDLSLAGRNTGFFSGDFRDDAGDQEGSFNENKIFKLEEDVEISSDLEKNINFIV
ncbi:flagellar hook-length control protein [Candidatus Borreliella tachyglossi]|uniref:Flagellar hook-length control protein n=1 Tax=Candidatus Borreliella tachyglossi TaxID=1964448 RepID=A0A2S1LWN7_9SPIR|nr:flagellar hook-length control protein FliK [Candidatus Borreliella tachyglossi]AWG42675.1 flagellar hook-length control protein [Candidatus Borreliella tachyglossi]